MDSHVVAATSAFAMSGNAGVITAVILAALLHAAWNAAAHHIPDRAAGLALLGVAYTVVSAAAVPWAAMPDVGAWGYLLGSVVLHVAYSRAGSARKSHPLAALGSGAGRRG